MNTTGKIVVGVIVVLIIAVGAYYWYSHSTMAGSSQTTASVGSNPTAAPASGTTGSGNSNPTTLPGGSSNSDAALNQDTAAIDTQMSGLNTDSTNINSAVNDQPIPQGQ